MKKIALLLFLATLALAAAPASADIMIAGPGQSTGSWTQPFEWVGTTINYMEIDLLTPGVTFEAPGIVFHNGWTNGPFTSTIVSGSGPLDINFFFDLKWTTAQSTPLQFEWFGYANGIDIDEGIATWNGSSWSFQSEAVPEPGSLALLGSGLIGIGTLVRRRRFFGRS